MAEPRSSLSPFVDLPKDHLARKTGQAEDKEKRNLKSLILSGVTATEYTFSMLVLPILIMLLAMIVLPIYLRVDVSGYLFAYVIYLLLATISIIFLNLLIGAVSDTQSKAQVYSIFPMLIVSFLPIIALQNDTAQKVLDYSFVGPIVNLLNQRVEKYPFLISACYLPGYLC